MIRLQPGTIPDLPSLKEALQKAIELEHATIPPYLAAYYTLNGTGDGARAGRERLRKIFMEEMEHMRLACNVLNAIDGEPKIGGRDFVPNYPGPLPMGIGGAEGLVVGIKRYSRETVHDTFMEIEEPEKPIDIPVKEALLAALPPSYETIGEFYAAIAAAIRQQGQAIFTGKPERQVPPDTVTDVASALSAIKTIAVQGEGTPTSPEQAPGDFAHYYLFAELYRGKKIVADSTSKVGYRFDPTQPIEIDNEKDVIKMADNPQDIDMSGNSQAQELADACDATYTELLKKLDATFNGQPDLLGDAETLMGKLRSQIRALLKQPIPSQPGYFAGPRFRWAGP